MKAKNLFLTLTLLLLLPLAVGAATATDAFDFSFYGGENGELSFGGLPCSSGAVYGGSISFAKKPTRHATMSTSQFVYTTTSPGTANRVSITWRNSGNTADESILKVYGKHSTFTGGETPSDLGTMPGVTLIGSHAYSSGSYTANIDVAAGYEYIAIATGDEKIDFTYIAITWTVPDVVNYSINITQTGSGYVWAEKPGDDDITEAAAGEEITIYFYGLDDGTELRSFSVYGESAIIDKALSEDEYTGDYSYTFTMPEHSVEVNAVLAAAPSPARSANPISVNGVANTVNATLKSGMNSTFVISTLYNAGTSPAYNKTLKSVTSSNTGVVQVVSNTYDYASGSGVLTLEGKATGTATVTITTYQTNGTQSSNRIINVTVEPREVMLVTELDGRYFALTNQSDGSYLHALELLYEDGIYYYDPTATYDVDDITWDMTTLQGLLEPYYYIQNPSNGKYLYNEGSEALGVVSASCRWFKDASSRLYSTGSVGIVYNGISFLGTSNTKWSSESTFSKSVYEVPIAEIEAAKQYSTTSGSANIPDSRSLTTGKMGTICVPFNVPMSFVSGATFYTIESKLVSAGNLTGLNLAEVTDKLEAGHSYIFEATGSSIDIYYGRASATNASVIANDGFVGMLPGDGTSMAVPAGVTPRTDGCYGIASNKLRYVAEGGTATIKPYRAYINAGELSSGAPAPGRRVVLVDNSENTENGENTATSIEDLLNNATSINWNEPVYNVLGQRVGEGTTGVLIQNGQKFFVQ